MFRLVDLGGRFSWLRRDCFGLSGLPLQPNRQFAVEYLKTAIEGVWVLKPRVFRDGRGYFMETYRKEDFDRTVGPVNFVQDNQSCSTRGVLRGLHYQEGEWSQAKLVRCLQGRVIDVAVDLRTSSPTFGQHVMQELNEQQGVQLFVPRGFAHGFIVLSEVAVFVYKVDNVYMPSAERSIVWNDPTIAIPWPLDQVGELNLSQKDIEGLSWGLAPKF